MDFKSCARISCGEVIAEAYKRAASVYRWETDGFVCIDGCIEETRTEENGDFCSSIAFKLSNRLKKSPEDIAEGIFHQINIDNSMFKSCSLSEAGFINFRIKDRCFSCALNSMLFSLNNDCGEWAYGGGRRELAVRYIAVGCSAMSDIEVLRQIILCGAVCDAAKACKRDVRLQIATTGEKDEAKAKRIFQDIGASYEPEYKLYVENDGLEEEVFDIIICTDSLNYSKKHNSCNCSVSDCQTILKITSGNTILTGKCRNPYFDCRRLIKHKGNADGLKLLILSQKNTSKLFIDCESIACMDRRNLLYQIRYFHKRICRLVQRSAYKPDRNEIMNMNFASLQHKRIIKLLADYCEVRERCAKDSNFYNFVKYMTSVEREAEFLCKAIYRSGRKDRRDIALLAAMDDVIKNAMLFIGIDIELEYTIYNMK